jgi:hypothetical protein
MFFLGASNVSSNSKTAFAQHKMTKRGSDTSYETLFKEDDVSKRQKPSTEESNLSQNSQDFFATIMPEGQPHPPIGMAKLMEIYNTHTVADNLDDPSEITRLRLRDNQSFYDDWEYGIFPFREFQTFALLPKRTYITFEQHRWPF